MLFSRKLMLGAVALSLITLAGCGGSKPESVSGETSTEEKAKRQAEEESTRKAKELAEQMKAKGPQ